MTHLLLRNDFPCNDIRWPARPFQRQVWRHEDQAAAVADGALQLGAILRLRGPLQRGSLSGGGRRKGESGRALEGEGEGNTTVEGEGEVVEGEGEVVEVDRKTHAAAAASSILVCGADMLRERRVRAVRWFVGGEEDAYRLQ